MVLADIAEFFRCSRLRSIDCHDTPSLEIEDELVCHAVRRIILRKDSVCVPADNLIMLQLDIWLTFYNIGSAFQAFAAAFEHPMDTTCLKAISSPARPVVAFHLPFRDGSNCTPFIDLPTLPP